MTLRLLDLEAPLDDVDFPNGTNHVPVPFGPTEYRLWRDLQKETDALARGTMLMQIVRTCYPTATDDDIESCTAKMLIAMAAHAGHRIEQVRAALKNADGAAKKPPEEEPPAPVGALIRPPLSPKTSGASSSRKSRARSGRTGGTPTGPAPTAAPS
jgi:hypothetical protein